MLMIRVFVPNFHGTGVMVRCSQPHADYTGAQVDTTQTDALNAHPKCTSTLAG